MIPVDLDRLREALGNEPEVAPSAIYLGHKASEEDHRLVLDTARAVLGAPQVWWCFGDDMKADPMCRWATATTVKPGHSRCGWVALVPVKGGQE